MVPRENLIGALAVQKRTVYDFYPFPQDCLVSRSHLYTFRETIEYGIYVYLQRSSGKCEPLVRAEEKSNNHVY